MDAPVPKRFSWSWSRLKNWRTCPKRHWECDIAKNYKDDGEASLWGKDLHSAMQRCIDKGAALPETMTRFEKWPAMVRGFKELGVDVATECEMAIDDQFKPSSWFDPLTWLRAKIDVRALNRKKGHALAIDWKTGKMKPEYEQLGITAGVIFATYPDVHVVDTMYVWFGHDAETAQRFTRTDMTQFWANLMPEIKQMEEAHRTLTYPPRPGPICMKWCPVTSCPYHGKGNH